MAKTSPDLIPGAGSGELAHGSLRLWDAIAISVSVIAPGMAMLLNVTGVAAVAGGSTPLAFLLGGIACLALAFVVIGFTRRMASAGYAYTYASRSLGKEAGFMAGWLYFFGFICFVPMTMSAVGFLAADLLGLNPKLWILFFFIGMTLFAVVLYLWTTYSITIGFGVDNGLKMGADPVALKTTATTFVGAWLGTLTEIGGMCAAFIVAVACATAAARTLFAMGREGVLPAAFGRTHERFKTPVNATVAVTVVATLMALLMGYPLSDATFGQPFSNYYFWATVGTLVIIIVYIMLCIGGIVFFWRTRESRNWNPLVHVAIPAIGAVVFGAALYGSIHPAPPGILRWTPLVAGVWLVIGVGVLLWLRSARPDQVAQIGSILGEEGGTDAAILDS